MKKNLHLINSNCCSRLVELLEEGVKNSIELHEHLHHWCMSAIVNKMQLAGRYKLVKFLGHKWRCDNVIITPDQKCWLFNLAEFCPKVISDRTFRKGDDFDCFNSVIHDLVYFINQFLGSSIG